ncbi:hypothetical protein ACIP93_00870 [Streptomyces sp. NPDC088745]|uniref:hypothetical protein n=1 Tax=Streptomyces sp. NPDC088745 TaxID=3365884 RepID=UPI00380D5712
MNTSDHAAPGPGLPEPATRPKLRLAFDDPLDLQSSDDTDLAWGDRPTTSGGTTDLARFLDEKPPHHV